MKFRNKKTGRVVEVEPGSVHEARLKVSDRVEPVLEDLEVELPTVEPETEPEGPEKDDDGEEE